MRRRPLRVAFLSAASAIALGAVAIAPTGAYLTDGAAQAANSAWSYTLPTVTGLTATKSGAIAGQSSTVTWGAASAAAGTPTYTVKRSLTTDFTGASTVYTGPALTTTDLVGAAPAASTNALANKQITDLDVFDVGGCAATPKGAYCWGQGSNSRIGDGQSVNIPDPVLVIGALGVRAVSAISTSASTTCAIASGVLYCWGAFPGNGSILSTTPVAVNVGAGSALAGETVTAVETPDYPPSGGGGACAVTASGKVACWGSAGNLALSGGTTDATTGAVTAVSSTIPRSLSTGALAGKTVTGLGSTGTVVCAMTSDNTVACWGRSAVGALGTGVTSMTSLTPVPVTMTGISGTVFQLLSGNQSYNGSICAATEVSVYCWGRNTITNPQVWKSWTATPRSMAVAGGGGFDYYQMTVDGMCGLRSQLLYCWGYDVQGSSGLGVRDVLKAIPTRVNTGTLTDKAIQQISSNGGFLNCAVTTAQRITCWGTESYGNFGNGDPNTNASVVFLTPTTYTNGANQACPDGALLLASSMCSLDPANSYYYQVTYTVSGATNWVSGAATAARQ